MEISDELKEKIEKLCSNNKKLMEELLSLDANAITYIGQLSQSKIEPKKIVEAYKEGKMEDIYKEALVKLELKKVYQELLPIYYAQRESQNNIQEER